MTNKSTRFMGLLTTMQCPLQCSHCMYECSPHRKERMTLQEMVRYIDEAAEHKIRVVLFSGGEPFLLGKDLDEAVAYATKKSIHTQCTTAAHWATSKQAAVDRLRRLAAAGLGSLNLSCDDYHQEFVPLRNVKLAVEAAVEVGLSFTINVVFTSQSKITKSFLNNELSDVLNSNGRYVEAKKLEHAIKNLARQRNVSTVAELSQAVTEQEKQALEQLRGYEIHPEPACEGSGRCVLTDGEEVPWFPLGHPTLNECNAVCSILVYPDGGVKACIGHMHSATEPVLHIGNLKEESLSDILGRAQENTILRCLELGGPGVITRHLLELEPSLKFNSSYRLSCHLCSDLFTNPDIRQALHKHINTILKRLTESPPRTSRLSAKFGGLLE
jgi:MoaA/NifB/PqqE/SkfB family radical SAM enzyme